MMHTTLRAILVTVIFLAVPHVVADPRDDALAILDRAIRAHGGEARLARPLVAVRTATGVIYPAGRELPITDELTTDLPDRFRLTLDIGEGQRKVRVVQVVGRERGWYLSNGAVNELNKERLDELRGEGYVLWLATLVPLRRESGFELAAIPEAKVQGKPMLAIRVVRKGEKDARLYFDPDTGLLTRIDRRATDAGLTFTQEYHYSDWKDFEGVKLPTRQVEMRSGKKFSELNGIAWRFLRIPDETALGKP